MCGGSVGCGAGGCAGEDWASGAAGGDGCEGISGDLHQTRTSSEEEIPAGPSAQTLQYDEPGCQ